MSATLPRIVLALTHNHRAWIVGSAADPKNKDPRDYDVIVPYSEWGAAAHLILSNAEVNSFGGWKLSVKFGYKKNVSRMFKAAVRWIEIDVWPGELSWVMERPQCMYAWSPATGVRLTKSITNPTSLLKGT